MDYKQAYNKLIMQVMEDDTVSGKTIEKAKEIHDELMDDIDSEQIQKEDFISLKDWNTQTYTERLKLKQTQPHAYENALEGKFKEVN